MDKYEIVILGLGAMGSAAAYQLAKRGAKVLGLDQFAPPHTYGSSHGDSRITRLAIGEGAQYTPLALRSHEIWREIEKETGADLLTQTGGLIISSGDRTAMLHVDNFFANTVAAAKAHGIAHELLDTADLRRRFPQFRVRDGEIGYFESTAGFLRPENCVRAQLALAQKHGATLQTGEKVLHFEPSVDDVTVTTTRSTYKAEKLVITAGPWLPELMAANYAQIFKILRQVLLWFDVAGPIEPFEPTRCPVFIWELQGPEQAIYGFPALDGARGGVKVATQQYEHTTTPQTVNREVSEAEISAMHETYVAPYLPDLRRECVKAVTCLYTVTPDAGFVIDTHPESERIILASPCSGHGFKHSAAIGEALAEIATKGRSRFDLSAFRLGRFAA
ncbi:MAG TPA: N-methyl-L-tryptophan oxidase [Micropepsaceae bacterium]|jgi:sarcosine oxidase|nr:N-methyl-L-tryptophan oxidase [Micropepsaceae bacterium]